jgi:hypothetical protein
VPYFLGIYLVSLLGVLLYAFLLFDRLVRAEYEQHRPMWEADGRPAGFFWSAKECGYLSHYTRIRLSFAWLFRTPAWVANAPPMVATLRRLRFAVLAWNVGFLSWFASFSL